MNDAQLIQRWQRCQDAAERLGVGYGTHGIGSNAKFFVRVGGTNYTMPTVDALWGFLDGVEAERRCNKRRRK